MDMQLCRQTRAHARRTGRYSTFFDAAVDGYICDDQVYGLPQEFNMEYGTVLVNQARFEAAGLTYPPAWANYEALTGRCDSAGRNRR